MPNQRLPCCLCAGLDARAAGLVMSTVRATVNTGRTGARAGSQLVVAGKAPAAVPG